MLAAMIGPIRNWLEKRRALRRRWQADALLLAKDQPRTSYYEAQRRAASARARGDADGFWHWANVAAEVARICPDADMDLETVKRIVDGELDKT